MLMTILLNTFGGMPPSPMIATGTIVHCVLYASIAMPVFGFSGSPVLERVPSGNMQTTSSSSKRRIAV